jgi:hypothetical protein
MPTKQDGILGGQGAQVRCVQNLINARNLRMKTGGESPGLPEDAPPVMIELN